MAAMSQGTLFPYGAARGGVKVGGAPRVGMHRLADSASIEGMRGHVALGLGLVLAFAACRTATEIDVTVVTDEPCGPDAGDGSAPLSTQITVSATGVEAGASSLSSACTSKGTQNYLGK